MSAKAIIEKRAHEKLTLSDVAAEVFISPCYLSRLFKTICGTSFQDYLTNVRIDRAKTLLRDTQMPCRAIGQQVGYESPSYFSKVFKQITGMSPTEFRQRC
jgi:two-component system response regulator YesN